MLPAYDDLLIKRFEQPDEVRTFEKGRFEIVKLGGMTIGRASYEPGWKWSAARGRSDWRDLLPGRACRDGDLGLCRLPDG